MSIEFLEGLGWSVRVCYFWNPNQQGDAPPHPLHLKVSLDLQAWTLQHVSGFDAP